MRASVNLPTPRDPVKSSACGTRPLRSAPRSAATIGLSYIAGGLLPLAPYALGLSLATAFLWSIGVTLLALLAFGAVKHASQAYRCCAVRSRP